MTTKRLGTTVLEGIKVGGENRNSNRYADNTVLIATLQTIVLRLVTKVEKESKKMVMTLNTARMHGNSPRERHA